MKKYFTNFANYYINECDSIVEAVAIITALITTVIVTLTILAAIEPILILLLFFSALGLFILYGFKVIVKAARGK